MLIFIYRDIVLKKGALELLKEHQWLNSCKLYSPQP